MSEFQKGDEVILKSNSWLAGQYGMEADKIYTVIDAPANQSTFWLDNVFVPGFGRQYYYMPKCEFILCPKPQVQDNEFVIVIKEHKRILEI